MWLLACQFHLVHSFTYSTDDYGDTAAFWTLYSVLVNITVNKAPGAIACICGSKQ